MTDEENPKMEEVPVEEQPEEQANTTATDDKALDGNTTIAINGVGVTMDGTQLPLVIVLISSIILLIATTSDATAQTTAYENYVISVSCISLILSFICLVVHKFGGDLYNKIGKYLCMTNFLWIFIGACFLTFRGPFQTTSNGFFAAWAAVYGCAMSMGMDTSAFKSNIRGLGAIMGHLAASIVVLVACISPVESLLKGSKMRNNAIYALSLACLSTLIMLVLMSMDRKGKQIGGMANLGLMSVIALCWLVAACLVTFVGPFQTTGNGYFASWAACITAGHAAFAAYKAK